MKKFKKIRDRIRLHPMMAFILLTGLVILVSGILDIFDASITYNRVNARTGAYESTLVTVESLLNLSGIKYIFSNTVANFVNFTPLSMLLIVLIGIGIMDRSGFLDTIFFVLTKNVAKTTVTFVFALLCIIVSITGDLGFIVLIPLSALLFKYGKRNPIVGIIMCFASVSLGYSINILISSTDSSLMQTTTLAAGIISRGYYMRSYAFCFIMLASTLIGAGLITYVTERIIAPKIGKYEIGEEEIVQDKDKLTRKEIRGLIFAGIGAAVYLLIIIYNIIPNVPFGGNLLDYSQGRYIDKLFGMESFFNSGFVFVVTFLFVIVGLLYGVGTKSIENHRDICNYLSHSLDGIGKIIVLIFFASMFVSLLRYTNIGLLLTAAIASGLNAVNFGGIPLIILVLFVGIVTTILAPNLINRWGILSGTLVPMMMTNGFTPEFAQMLFSVGTSIAYGITPAMAYFVIYVSFLEKYDKDGVSIIQAIKYIIPYVLVFLVMWIALLIIWYLVGIPLGIDSFIVL
ncbi:MAG: AbgT family transporter [Bacilli bacterium]|nr:AbgT family transporter [Bacilli bacterium]